ncbi:MAG: hypothetical protein ABW046_12660 [Actinoplanes sp.]
MALVREFEDDEYWPEYGLIVVRDPAAGEGDGSEPTGTFAGAGPGWMTAQAGGGCHVVRLELHDSPPPADHDSFHDVLETPYRASSGGLSLTTLTSGVGEPDLELGDGGPYRLRVGRRAGFTGDGTGDLWLFRFWPSPAPSLPMWLVRSGPAAGPGDNGWSAELESDVLMLSGLVGGVAREHGGTATVAQVTDWVRTHMPMHPADWLDQPLWPPPSVRPTTGHADLDQSNAEQRTRTIAWLAGKQRRVDEIAAELGVPPVARRRDVLPLLAAAGILDREGADGYRIGRPGPVDSVLSLPPERVRAVRERDARSRFGNLAEDVEAVLRWAPGTPLEIAAAALAARLLVSESDLIGALAFAERAGLLHVDGDEQLKLRPGRRPTQAPAAPPNPASAPAPAPALTSAAAGQRASGRVGVPVRRSGSGQERLPLGAPPRAGVVTAGGVVTVWRDGSRVDLARIGAGHWERAVQTRHGVLVAGFGQTAWLISADGAATEVDAVRGRGFRLLGDGRQVVTSHSEHRRGTSRSRLRAVDLGNGRVTTMPWPEDQEIGLLGAYRNTVFFLAGRDRTTMRWEPGSVPEPFARPVLHIDPVSGLTSTRTAAGVEVTRPDGTTVTMPVDTSAEPAPGGEWLWTTRPRPPAITLFPIGPEVSPQVWWLPTDRAPVWEDTEHVLFGYPFGPRLPDPSCGVRLAVRDGVVQCLPPVTGDAAVTFVEPLAASTTPDAG